MSRFRHFILAPLLLGGCVVGPDYAGPPELGGNQQSTFVRQMAGATANQPTVSTWWTGLQDAVLDELERRALASNPSLEAAEARIRQARASVRQERAALLPTAGAQGTAVIAHLPGVDLQANPVGGGPSPPPTSSSSEEGGDTSLEFYNLGLNANWEIDLAGGQVRRIEAADALAAAAAYNAADAQVRLTAEVAQAYTNLRDRQQRAIALRRARDLQQQQLDLAQQRFRNGTASALSVTHVKRALQGTTSDLAAAEAEIAVYLDALAVLAGESPGSLDTLLAKPRDVPVPPQAVAIGDPASLLRRRPDIRAAERQLAAATARIGIAEAARFPKISFMGILGIGGASIEDIGDGGDVSKIAVPQLQWGLLDFGRTAAAVAQTRAGRDEAEAQYRQVVLRALQDAETSLSRFAQHRLTVAALVEVKRSADDSAALTRQRYERGVISLSDSLEAERQRLLAEANLRSAVAALTGSYVAIQKSLGLGWSEAGVSARP